MGQGSCCCNGPPAPDLAASGDKPNEDAAIDVIKELERREEPFNNKEPLAEQPPVPELRLQVEAQGKATEESSSAPMASPKTPADVAAVAEQKTAATKEKAEVEPVIFEENPEAAEAPVSMVQQNWNKYMSGNMSEKETEFLADKDGGVARRPSSENISFEDYIGQHSDIFSTLKDLEKPDGWVLKKTVDGVDIFTMNKPGDACVYTKGVVKMKTHGNGIRHLLANLMTAEDRPKYDELCSAGRTVESYLPFYRVVCFQMITPAIIANREVLTVSRVSFEKDGSCYIATESLEHPSAPVTPGYVRAEVQGGYIFHPTSDPDEYEVIFAVRSDPMGWLPGWLKALVAWKVQLILVSFSAFYNSTYGPK